MIEELSLMQRLFDRYGLPAPLPAEAQRRALRAKRRNLVATMKRLGIHSPLYGMILAVFFFLRKAGLGISVTQSAALFFAASAIAVSSVAAGGYFAVKSIAAEKPSIRAEAGKSAAPAAGPDVKAGEAAAGTDRIAYRYRLQYYGLENNGADNALAAQVSDGIRSEIIRMKGRDRIAVSAEQGGAELVLTGSIERLDRQYLLSVRLTDRRTRRIIFAASRESATAEGLRDVGVTLARSIADNIQ